MNSKLLKNFILIPTLIAVFVLQLFLFEQKPISVFADSPSITNGDFANNPSRTIIETSPSGWSIINSSNATSGVININENTFAESSYELSADLNPGKMSSAIDDDKVFMINSKNANDSIQKSQGYRSNDISLSSYSYYKITALAYTQLNAKASIYLQDSNDNYENIKYFERFSTSNAWNVYNFYIATGIDAQKVAVAIYLGASNAITSPNAVFFDEIEIEEIPEKDFVSSETDFIKTINYQSYLPSVINNDFENNLNGWNFIDGSNATVRASAFDMTSQSLATSQELPYLGTDNSANNTHALVLSSDTPIAAGYSSSDIILKQNDILKISVNVKVDSISSQATVALRENEDVKEFYTNQGLTIPSNITITPVTKTISISSNSTNEITNDYRTVSFFVKGHALYDTTLTLELWLGYIGEETTTSSGTVAYDNIKIEEVSYSKYSNATSDDFIQKYELSTLSGTQTITNGNFNATEKEDATLTYPVKPASWTHDIEEENSGKYGVININQTHYEANKSNYGNFANPGHKNSPITDTNNIMMLWNNSDTYQSITSPSVSITSSSYQKINFDYKTIATTSNTKLMFVQVLDSNKNVIYTDGEIISTNWSNYEILIRSGATSPSVSIKIGLGNADNKVQGILYIDRLNLETVTMTDSDYDAYVQANGNVIDYTSGSFNLISYEKDSNNLYSPLAFTKVGTSDIAFAGIVNPTEDLSIPTNSNNTNSLKNMIMIETLNAADCYLVSNESVALTSGKYYKFSIYIKTILTDNVSVEEDEVYGATFALDGLDEKITGIKENEEFTLYEIYVAATSDTSVKLKFGYQALNYDTKGIAYFDFYNFEELTDTVYNNAKATAEEQSLKTSLFIGDTDVEPEDEENDDENTGSQFDFLIIPSLILSVALIIALVGYVLKKVKIKKFVKRKSAEYDRNMTLYRDVIRQEAEQKRNENVKECKKEIEQLKQDLAEIEEQNQQRLKENRRQGKRVIDKKTEAEFKSYAKTHTAIENKIERIENKILDMNTDDYLLSLQKTIYSQSLKKKLENDVKSPVQTPEEKPKLKKKKSKTTSKKTK